MLKSIFKKYKKDIFMEIIISERIWDEKSVTIYHKYFGSNYS